MIGSRYGVTVVHIRTRRQYVNGGTKNLQKTVVSNANRLAYNFAQTVESVAKRRVHVITGRLRDSIVRVKIAPGHHKVIVGAYYGVYEEYGTRYRPPHPYFRPAVMEAKAKYENDKRKVFQS